MLGFMMGRVLVLGQRAKGRGERMREWGSEFNLKGFRVGWLLRGGGGGLESRLIVRKF